MLKDDASRLPEGVATSRTRERLVRADELAEAAEAREPRGPDRRLRNLAVAYRVDQGHTRVLQLYINLIVWRSNVSEKASTFRELEERRSLVQNSAETSRNWPRYEP